MEKHKEIQVMLSYPHSIQSLVKKVYIDLDKKFHVWMDIYGGIENDVNTEMAEGVENADVFICFCTKDYQKSHNCKKELEYADLLRFT